MTFHIGQKVVCVDDENHFRDSFIAMGTPVIRVEELKREYSSIIDGENVYAAARFRPVIEHKTDISIFKGMLNPDKQRVDA